MLAEKKVEKITQTLVYEVEDIELIVKTYLREMGYDVHSLSLRHYEYINLIAEVSIRPKRGNISSLAHNIESVEKTTMGTVHLYHNPEDAVRGADVVYTDVWASMGQEKEADIRRGKFSRYQVNKQLMSLADNNSVVMHCLPAHRGEEITDEVLDGDQSIVWAQAENRLHVQKAIMVKLMAQ